MRYEINKEYLIHHEYKIRQIKSLLLVHEQADSYLVYDDNNDIAL